jgi:hypothetical protein
MASAPKMHADLPQISKVGPCSVTGLQLQWDHASACGHHMSFLKCDAQTRQLVRQPGQGGARVSQDPSA